MIQQKNHALPSVIIPQFLSMTPLVIFLMQLHVVAYNTDYPDATTATTKEDGLAVFGFFFQVKVIAYSHLCVRILSMSQEWSLYCCTQIELKSFQLLHS